MNKIRRAMRQIARKQEDTVRMIGTLTMREEQTGGDWAKQIAEQNREAGKNADYLRGFFDGLQVAYEIIAGTVDKDGKGDDQ